MRSIWSGSISFGLVNIPIKLYSSRSSSHEVDFDMLHAKELSPIRYARICKQEGVEIPFSEITKGVDTGGGNYVMINAEDFAKALPKKTKSIEIISFCNIGEVDPVYFELPYYLEPDKQSDKPYQLLLHALEKTKKVGIARFVLRAREHLVMLRPYQGLLMLIQLRFYDELADLSQIRFPFKSAMSNEEVTLAEQLINQISSKFDPSNYNDTFALEMRKIIRQKIEGKEIVPMQEEPVPTEVNNLIETLSKSLTKK